MAKIDIKSFSEIDFLTVNAAEDKFVLPDGSKYQCSDFMCDNCWTAGTILELIDENPIYFCIMCENDLEPVFFKNDFLQPTGDELRFLLPKKWSMLEKEAWYQSFKERRIQQEEFRSHIMNQGKE